MMSLGGKLARVDFIGQRVLNALLDGPFQRSRAVDRVEAFLGQFQQGGVGDLPLHFHLRDAFFQIVELDAGDVLVARTEVLMASMVDVPTGAL